MKRYSLKAFLTLTPQERLKQYFEKNTLLTDFDWDEEFTVEELHDAISLL